MKGKLPFGMGTVNLGFDFGTAQTLGVLVIGMLLFHATDDVGSQAWGWVKDVLSSATGFNIGSGGQGLQLGA